MNIKQTEGESKVDSSTLVRFGYEQYLGSFYVRELIDNEKRVIALCSRMPDAEMIVDALTKHFDPDVRDSRRKQLDELADMEESNDKTELSERSER